jgi:hypothetical protein
VDPVLAARAFMGMLVYHFMIQELFGARNHLKKTRAEVAEELVDIWLHGMISTEGKSSSVKLRAQSKSGLARKSEKHE